MTWFDLFTKEEEISLSVAVSIEILLLQMTTTTGRLVDVDPNNGLGADFQLLIWFEHSISSAHSHPNHQIKMSH